MGGQEAGGGGAGVVLAPSFPFQSHFSALGGKMR